MKLERKGVEVSSNMLTAKERCVGTRVSTNKSRRVHYLPKASTCKGCQWACPHKSPNFLGHFKILPGLRQDPPTSSITSEKGGSQKRNWALFHRRRDPEWRFKYSEHQIRFAGWKRDLFYQAFPEARLIILKITENNLLFPEWEISTSVSTQFWS